MQEYFNYTVYLTPPVPEPSTELTGYFRVAQSSQLRMNGCMT